jgi:hypothetical protein
MVLKATNERVSVNAVCNTRVGVTLLTVGDSVNYPKRRCGQRHEEARVKKYRLVDSLAADEASRRHDVGVGFIEIRTRGTDGAPAILAGHGQAPAKDLSRSDVDHLAGDAYWVGAVTGLSNFGQRGSTIISVH